MDSTTSGRTCRMILVTSSTRSRVLAYSNMPSWYSSQEMLSLGMPRMRQASSSSCIRIRARCSLVISGS